MGSRAVKRRQAKVVGPTTLPLLLLLLLFFFFLSFSFSQPTRLGFAFL
jgi:hypothetical protein